MSVPTMVVTIAAGGRGIVCGHTARASGWVVGCILVVPGKTRSASAYRNNPDTGQAEGVSPLREASLPEGNPSTPHRQLDGPGLAPRGTHRAAKLGAGAASLRQSRAPGTWRRRN